MCFFVPWKNKGNVSPCELPHRSATDPLMILLTCSNWQLQIPSSWLAGKTMLLLLLLPFRSPHAQHTSVNPEKTKQQPGLKNTSEVMCFFSSSAVQISTLLLLSAVVFSHSGRSPPILRWALGSRLRPVVKFCHFLPSLRHVPPRSPPLVCLLRTSTAWTWSRGAAPVQVTSTRPRTAARACLPSCRALRSTTVTLVSQLAVTPADIGILYLTKRKGEEVGWQSFTVAL